MQLRFRGGPEHAQSTLTPVSRYNPENLDLRAEGPTSRVIGPRTHPPPWAMTLFVNVP